MKKCLFIFFWININAQVDTTILYPLDVGNYWEYTDYTSTHWYETVVGEEEMPNGKIYKKLQSVDLIDGDTSYSYILVEENTKVFWYKHELDNPYEEKEYDFSLPQGSVWLYGDIFRQIAYRGYSYNNLVGDTVLVDQMIFVYIDSLITPPDTSVIIDIYDYFAKGIGPILYGWPTIRLTGLIINGFKYGFITVDVKNEPIKNNYQLDLSVFPNPFNSSTTIHFKNPQAQEISVDMYNLIGEKVMHLTDKFFFEGEHQISLNMESVWGSGVYFILLTTKEKHFLEKIIYLK
jgi:hypothetical protein